MRKWHSFKMGKYKLVIFEKRVRHTGIGYRLGCGHNIIEICHAFFVDGVERWKKTVKYEVEFDA